MSILHSTCIWFQPSYCMNGDENSCFRCLLGRKIGSLVTQPQPTIDWHHFLQNYHVLFFVVISFDDSENPNNQLANSFDFTGFLQEMSTSQVLRRGNSDKATKGFVQSDPFETTARWKKKIPTELPTDLGWDSRFCLEIFLTWPYYPRVVSVSKTTKLSVWPLDLFAKLLCRYMWKPVEQQTQKIRNLFFLLFPCLLLILLMEEIMQWMVLKNTVNWLN